MNDIKLFEQNLGDNAKMAILRVENFVGGIGSADAVKALNTAIVKYCAGTPVVLFVDTENPYERMILKGLDTLSFEIFSMFLKKRERKNKIKEINKITNEKTI